jgi:hypothetical protein
VFSAIVAKAARNSARFLFHPVTHGTRREVPHQRRRPLGESEEAKVITRFEIIAPDQFPFVSANRALTDAINRVGKDGVMVRVRKDHRCPARMQRTAH